MIPVNKHKFKMKTSIIVSLILTLLLNLISYGENFNQDQLLDHKKRIDLSRIEKDYIIRNPIITVLVMEGVAPIQYIDRNGEFKGITKHVLDEIMERTGLVFEYKFTNYIDEILGYKGEAIVAGISHNYAPAKMVLSQPFLKSSTILYLQSSIEAQNLDEKIYAGILESKLPEGVKEENTKYYHTREDSLNAVESGEADYGYGNAFSVAFYTLQNGYRNIITIPNEKETREYSMGFLNENKVLVSIINKSLKSIDEITMQNLILKSTSSIDRKITIFMILDSYKDELLIMGFGIIVLLILGIIFNIRSNIKLQLQNKRYKVLSSISNEYLYEYFVKTDTLVLSEESIKLFGSQEIVNSSSKKIKIALLEMQSHQQKMREIEL